MTKLGLPTDDILFKPASSALIEEEVIRVLRAMAEAMKAPRDSGHDGCELYPRMS
ncbi:hypothetical protein [Limimaricola sp. AA108-03]|uniref:hypothetical protein n=1 Tax=Limimaricola sp. AA108-03 TaxID=3425945 RepID=UPI003D78531C